MHPLVVLQVAKNPGGDSGQNSVFRHIGVKKAVIPRGILLSALIDDRVGRNSRRVTAPTLSV